MSTESRQAATAALSKLITLLRTQPGPATDFLVQECEALVRAVNAFHMEGIRFRIFNVDRQISRARGALPAEATALLEETRRHLEAAGFHTRSHQAPG
jgi:hypothetical protein